MPLTMSRWKAALAATVALTLGGATAALAVDGDPSPSWGDDGSAWAPIDRYGNGNEGVGPVVAATPDGGAIVGSGAYMGRVNQRAARIANGTAVELVRFDAAGKAVQGFGDGGTAVLPGDSAEQVVVLPDGSSLVLRGSSGSRSLVKLKPDGTPDATFGPDGSTSIAAPEGSCRLGPSAANASGRFLLVWLTDCEDENDAASATLTAVGADGTPDATFGQRKVELPQIDAVALDARGNAYVLGTGPAAEAARPLTLLRYAADGTRDTSYGGPAVLQADRSARGALAVGSSGRAVVSVPRASGDGAWTAAAFTAAGALDPAFGDGGVAKVASPSFDGAAATGVIVLDDDRVLLRGPGPDAGEAIARLTSSGALDPGFASGGVAVLSDDEPIDFGTAALASNGDVLAAAQTDCDLRCLFGTSARASRSAPASTPALGAFRLAQAKAIAPPPPPPPATTTSTTAATTPSSTTTTETSTQTTTATTTPVTTSSAAPTPVATSMAPKPSPVVSSSIRTCLSRRSFTIRLRPGIKRGSKVSVVVAAVKVNGRAVKVTRTDRLRARVDLKTLPYGRFRVSVKLTLSNGKVVYDDRSYRTCRVGKSDRPAPDSAVQ